MFARAALLAVVFAAAAHASCPNACSGHGTCGEHDQCTCFRNWMANDCSQRVCQYDWAFVTTPQGDLNMDGDIYDSHYYGANGGAKVEESGRYNPTTWAGFTDDSDIASDTITSYLSSINLVNQQQPGGTWEMWPGYAAVRNSGSVGSADEGHFYMECSNRGLCDRKSGQCECFDGYEGSACRRTVCPNGCSGHGTCESVAELGSTQFSASSIAYTLWDADKSMSCKCDAGFAGADCSERQCPMGDDPLTTKSVVLDTGASNAASSFAQHNEQVWIDVYSHGGGATGQVAAVKLAGYIQLQYVDDYGETWWTDLISVWPQGTNDADCVVDGFTLADADASGACDDADLVLHMQNALQGIPNSVFESVSVSIEAPNWIIPGEVVIATNVATLSVAGAPETGISAAYTAADYFSGFACQAFTGATDSPNCDTAGTYGTNWVTSQCAAAPSGTCTGKAIAAGNVAVTGITAGITADDDAAGNAKIWTLASANGVRFKVNFTANSGDLNDFSCLTNDRHSQTEQSIIYPATTYSSAGAIVAGYTSTCVATSRPNIGFTNEASAKDSSTHAAYGTDGDHNLFTDLHLTVTTSSSPAVGEIKVGDKINFQTAAGADHTFTFKSTTWTDANKQGVVEVFEDVGTVLGVDTEVYGSISYNFDGTTELKECSGRGLCDYTSGLCECFKGYTDDDCHEQSVLAA